MKNTLRPNANRTHSLHFGDDGSLHSNYVQNRTPKNQPESISVNVRNRIPVVSSKSSLVRKGEVHTVKTFNDKNNANNNNKLASQPQSNVILASLQPTRGKPENSVSISQPKDLNTSATILEPLQGCLSCLGSWFCRL